MPPGAQLAGTQAVPASMPSQAVAMTTSMHQPAGVIPQSSTSPNLMTQSYHPSTSGNIMQAQPQLSVQPPVMSTSYHPQLSVNDVSVLLLSSTQHQVTLIAGYYNSQRLKRS